MTTKKLLPKIITKPIRYIASYRVYEKSDPPAVLMEC